VSALPLAGRTIVVTRARQQVSRLSRELEVLGARVIEIPTIEIVPPDSYAPLDAALSSLQQYQWLIFTSANTVRVFAERLSALGLASEIFAGLHCATVGSATATALRELGVRVDVVPRQYVAESLIDALRDRVAGRRVLLARAVVARDVIPDELRRLGATVDVVDAYRTLIPKESAALLRDVFASDAVLPDAVTFTSSSTVTNFFQLLRDAGFDLAPPGVRALSIGPITSATLREQGWEPAAEADLHDVAGLVQIAIEALP
jgi:uroporphyrinogen-III synthase